MTAMPKLPKHSTTSKMTAAITEIKEKKTAPAGAGAGMDDMIID